jgi:hypothetical protein
MAPGPPAAGISCARQPTAPSFSSWLPSSSRLSSAGRQAAFSTSSCVPAHSECCTQWPWRRPRTDLRTCVRRWRCDWPHSCIAAALLAVNRASPCHTHCDAELLETCKQKVHSGAHALPLVAGVLSLSLTSAPLISEGWTLR